MAIEDNFGAIDALSDDELVIRIDDIRLLRGRTAMYAARRWARLKYPEGPLTDAIQAEAIALFRRPKETAMAETPPPHPAPLPPPREPEPVDSNWPVYLITGLVAVAVIGLILSLL